MTMRLRAVTRTQGNVRALKEGLVEVPDYELLFEEVPVLVHAFRRMVRDLEFDICEMALTTYLCGKAAGKPFTAIPVFLVRGFHHAAIVTSGRVRDPRELEGRRVGVNRGYTVTTGVWARGVLHDEYDVDLDAVTWVPTGDEHVAEYLTPSNVTAPQSQPDLVGRVAGGELAAAVGIGAQGTTLQALIPSAEEAGFAALRGRGHYPINHTVVVRDELLNTHPDLAEALFTAYATSKACYIGELRAGELAQPSGDDVMYRRVMAITGEDPLPYGVEPNRAVLDELIRHALDQHILDGAPPVESLFAQGTARLVG
jgi:4,5-dihydroxyphthalate decarboxylase